VHGRRGRRLRRARPPAPPGSAPVLPGPERLPVEIRVLVGAAFVVALGYGIAAPALPLLARSFDVGVTAASAVVSAFAVVRIVFAPVSGRLVDRLGELRVFCGGLVVVGLSSAACAFATSFGQLLLLRAAGGAGSTLFTVSEAALVLRVAPAPMRGRASGTWATGFLLGTITGPVVGGVLTATSLRAPFLVYAALLAVATALTGALLRGRIGPPPLPPEAVEVGLAGLLRHPTFRAALIANFLNGWTVYGVRIALVPLFVVEALRGSDAGAGAALTAFAVGTAAALPLGGRWSDRRGRRPPALAGTAVVAVTAGCLGFSTSVAGLVTVAVVGGIGTGLMTPAVNAAVGDLLVGRTDGSGGRALAGFQVVGDLGAVTGPVLTGGIVDQAGYPAGFAVTAIIAVIAFVVWSRAPETAAE
jgi:MFS family permease